jgi:mannosyltransferase OCH1-like enzyme
MSLFKNLMGGSFIDSWDLVPNGTWSVMESMYDNFLNDNDKNQRIPKKIHQIWLGEMPELHKNLIPNIIKNHPDWEYKLWGEEDLQKLPMQNKKLFDSLTNLGAKSDIARYEILYNEGGIYLDSDFEMVTSFDSLIHNDFFTGVGHSNEPMVFNGLIGCTKKNKIIKNILYDLNNSSVDNDITDVNQIMSFCGPYFFSKHFFNYVNENKNDKIVVLPTPYFYCLPATEREKVRKPFGEVKDYVYQYTTDKTICIHLWYNSWQ